MLGQIISPALFPSGYFFYAFLFFFQDNDSCIFFKTSNREPRAREGGREGDREREGEEKMQYFLVLDRSFVWVYCKWKIKHIVLYQTSIDQRDSWFNYAVEESQEEVRSPRSSLFKVPAQTIVISVTGCTVRALTSPHTSPLMAWPIFHFVSQFPRFCFISHK